MRWVVLDSLYCREQFFCSHLDSYSWYLAEAGEDVSYHCLSGNGPSGFIFDGQRNSDIETLEKSYDVVFALDRYDECRWLSGRVRIAQVAAVCPVMPWEVRNEDGSPVYDLVISSIPVMVERARAAGCRAEYQPLAFDLRARACGMGVKREKKCIFIGTTGPNHLRRTQLLHQLGDLVQVLPPVFGRDYFRALARASVVFNPHAEWCEGVANNMRLFEAAGMGAHVVTDVDPPPEWPMWFSVTAETTKQARQSINDLVEWPNERERADTTAEVLLRHTYESRIPQLIAWAGELLEAPR